MHSHALIVFYKLRRGWNTDDKELDRFEMLIRKMCIDRMVFFGWFNSKSICYFNSISDISNDYHENGMIFT